RELGPHGHCGPPGPRDLHAELRVGDQAGSGDLLPRLAVGHRRSASGARLRDRMGSDTTRLTAMTRNARPIDQRLSSRARSRTSRTTNVSPFSISLYDLR